MCDESLNATVDSLLSRISKLEDQIKLASFGTPIVTAPTAEPPVVKDSKPAEAKKEEKPKKVEEVKPKSIGKPKLRTLRCKMEVADKLSQTDIPASSFVKNAKAYESEDGTVIFRFEGDFAISMLTKPKTKDAFIASLSSALGRPINEASVKLELQKKGEESEDDLLDELLND